ncbi:bile acid:sodium symporter family protein [Echinicola jeungdonensis]|uniref:Bile acid:sodium symporter family protein n=1 Tax=Echinicola jeungdonensis TaxID=709343 RepID=A0ABV5J882_9BACT|nr:bile acid:sodium symporter family protein [Echinicola jeungdonensis]MDN3670998.1 bile acid:sodium symporter family protein [Echinicola jeungdonensis]
MSKFKQILKKAGFNGFFVALIGTIFLAYLFPEWGSEKSWVPLDEITYYGISLIFFFYGVKLDPVKLGRGLQNWKLHVVIQCTTFLLFPVMVLVVKSIFGTGQSNLWLGAFYLSALPSTVSASVVMVSIAGGNIPAAIFNASISSIVGVFLTPVWMELFLDGVGMEFDLLMAFWKLSLQVLFPVIIGFILHRILGGWVQKYNQTLKYFDQTIILCIVFSAFSASFEREMFAGHSWLFLIGLGGLMLGLFLWMATLMYGVGRSLGFSKEDQITVLFCGSKKSLVQGAAMGRVLFPDPVTFGVILLPLMIYHSLQLVAGSVIAQQLAQQMKLRRRVS